MRLIDADELKRGISQNNKIPRIFQQVINSQPTAYSVDKVVEELEKAKHEIASEDYCRSINDKGKCDGRNCFECCAEYLIEIVKQGVISDDVCEWKEDAYGRWHTECNMLADNNPLEYTYCPYCKKKIKVVDDDK